MKVKTLQPLTWCLTALLAVLPATLAAQTASPVSTSAEVEALKTQLSEQQKQIDMLKLALEDQKKLLEHLSNAAPAAGAPTAAGSSSSAQDNQNFTLPSKTLGQVASATPVLPPASPAPVPVPRSVLAAAQQPAASSANPCEAPLDTANVPPYLRLGSVCVVPIGFMDATFVSRDVNAQSVIGSNFGSIPYNNNVQAKLNEARFSIANSRLGFRIDGNWKGWHFIGYNEFDFLGTSGANNITVTNGAVVPRIRLYWIDARKDKVEFLAGQSWSMLTPNRSGISALPVDLFFSQSIDVSYVAGLTWSRQPGMRVLYHPAKEWTLGFSAENPEQYGGGSLGGSGITLPAAYTPLSGTQINTGNEVLAAPTVNPDFIAKIAYDPGTRAHFEIGGVERTFKIESPGLTQHSTNKGAGLLFGMNVDVWRTLRIISTNFWSDGGGRYLTGQAPDFIVRPNGSISPVKADGSVDGFEAVVKNTLLYGYWGGIVARRNTAIDTNGSLVGFGFKGAPNTMNRAINEITFGFNQTMWRNPRYGAINLMGQYYWAQRSLWYVAAGPKGAHDDTIFMDIRYTLPGSMPNF
ncbi:MAG TPA: hypothetical protein VMH05_15370 [Bryobacteraceae bacterium]|nr:hypothetical protein [Bryobacteraceae bacterium]